MKASRMFAAIAAALVAAVLSLGGAALVAAGQPDNKGNGPEAAHGNGNAKSHGNADSGNGQSEPAAPQSRGNAGGNPPASAPSKPKAQRKSSGGDAKPRSEQPRRSADGQTRGGGSGSTGTSGPGSSAQGCDGTHHSDTGHGANQGGPYDNTCDGSPSGNGNGDGKATGKPCAGCVGNADDKNPKGQMANGSDRNAGYECDRNKGIGRTNPAHTGCTASTPETAGDTDGGKGEETEGVTLPKAACPDSERLGNALANSATLALAVLAQTHPALKVLADATEKSCGGDKNETTKSSDNGGGHTPITICHATGSATNPYVVITIDENGLNGHGDHQDGSDIIPAPAEGCPAGQTVAGEESTSEKSDTTKQNQNENGGGHTPITICHATGSTTNPYVVITIDENGLNGHGDHQDGSDIIPAPAEGCPTTPAPEQEGQQTTTKTPSVPTPPTEGQTVAPVGGEAPAAPVSGEAPAAPLTRAPAPGQAVLGEQAEGGSAPAATPQNEVLGENAEGVAGEAAEGAPAAATQAQPAEAAGGSLPFTGTEAILVLFIGCVMILGGVALQRVAARRAG